MPTTAVHKREGKGRGRERGRKSEGGREGVRMEGGEGGRERGEQLLACHAATMGQLVGHIDIILYRLSHLMYKYIHVHMYM